MTVEASLFLALKDLVGSRMYRDIAPANVTALPRGTFQQVGGESINFLDGTAPGLHLPRIQVNFWAATRDEANALARQGEAALRAYSSLQTTVLGEPIDNVGDGRYTVVTARCRTSVARGTS